MKTQIADMQLSAELDLAFAELVAEQEAWFASYHHELAIQAAQRKQQIEARVRVAMFIGRYLQQSNQAPGAIAR